MAPCFTRLSVLCVAFLTQGVDAWAQQERHMPLRLVPVAEMKRRGETANVDFRAEIKLTLARIDSGHIGQPATFEVDIHNVGTFLTPADASLLVRFTAGPATEEYGLAYGVLAPGKKRTVRFKYRPVLPTLNVEVTEGIWDSKSTGTTRVRAAQRFSFLYDPKAPLTDFLPDEPHTARQQTVRLPGKLSEVPEVFFGEPLPSSTAPGTGSIQVAGALAKIAHVNRKKTDAYMELLLGQRSDLAGLPFVLGDACRKKGEARQEFALTTNRIRDIQRSGAREDARRSGRAGISTESNPEDFADNRQMTEVLKTLDKGRPIPTGIRVAALWQMMSPESAGNRLEVIKYLQGQLPDVDAARTLTKLAIYSEEERIRWAALDALKNRREHDGTDILTSGLSYPWPAVAERASAAIARLGRTDLLPQLQEVLRKPDPRAPQTRMVDGKPRTFVRELVRINHLHNCMLCHAPAEPDNGWGAVASQPKEDDSTGEAPSPGEAIEKYYGNRIPDLLVRFDVTYLRQDFSVALAVEKAEPWPRMQRYDFVVRTRDITEDEARAWQKLLPADGASPYHRAARAAIMELSVRRPESR